MPSGFLQPPTVLRTVNREAHKIYYQLPAQTVLLFRSSPGQELPSELNSSGSDTAPAQKLSSLERRTDGGFVRGSNCGRVCCCSWCCGDPVRRQCIGNQSPSPSCSDMPRIAVEYMHRWDVHDIMYLLIVGIGLCA